MKNFTLLLMLILMSFNDKLKGQQNYCDFENIKFVSFGPSNGLLDTNFTNPDTNIINSSPVCARFIRDSTLYANVRIYPYDKLMDVTPYLNNSFQTPRIKMKIFSTAPAGTRIELQLGSKFDDSYPTGVHGEFVAVTSIQNSWQNLTFNYFQTTPGGFPSAANIDKIVILFRPNSSAQDTFYFDDLMGPELVTAVNSPSEDWPSAKLFQNVPNPAKDISNINFQINGYSWVSLEIFDLLGNRVQTVVNNRQLKPGIYSYPVETQNIPNGIYFYILKADGITRSMKMTVSN